MKGIVKGTLRAKFTYSKLLAIAWLLLNGSVLYFLQSQLKQAYTNQQAAQEVLVDLKVQAAIIKETQVALKQEQAQPILQSLKAFAEGGILPKSNLIIKNLPEEVSLRSLSLQQTFENIALNPAKLQSAGLEEESQLFSAGMAAYVHSAEDTCLWGIITIALVNLVVLVAGFQYANFFLFSRLGKLQNNINSENFEVLTRAERNDEIGSLTNTISGIKQEIAQAATLVHKTGEGEFEEVITEGKHPITSKLFNAIQRMQSRMQQVAEDDKQRNWTSHGLAKFVDILRSKDDDLQALSDTILAELVKYTGSNQGAIYLKETNAANETVLRQQACFAFGRKKWLDKEVLPGEGIIGQAFFEKETVYLTEVPAEYINITSGLGDAPPTSVLIVPLVINEEVMGVVELAGFNPFQKYQIAFVEKLGENIAATLASVRNNQTTRKLLEESQMMAENMRAQEEEMRQNMEELTATQEEMVRKEIELNGHMNAINNTLATIEFDLDGRILTANGIFLDTMNYQLEEIKGMHHKMFCTADYVQSKDYTEFWASFRLGKSHSGEYLHKDKNGRDAWFRASYTPVLDNNNNPIKVIECAFDITERKAMEEAMQGNMEAMQAQEEVLKQNMEEMQAQEEEMRQSMEELTATQEEMTRKEIELNGQMNAINNTLATIEFDLEGNVMMANGIFLDTMKYKIEEIQGMHHRMFCETRYAESQEYKDFWLSFKQGKSQSGEFLRRDKEGNDVWLRASYTAVLDQHKRPIKVIKCAFDITERKKMEAEADMQMQQMKAQEEAMLSTFEEMQQKEEALQQNMEEMQAQEEELRQNMEEMSAIQEELGSKMTQNEALTREMNARIAALDEAAILFEFNVEGNITYTNTKGCDITGYNAEELQGKSISIMRHPDTPEDFYSSLWATIKEGKVFKGRFPNIAKDNKVYWMETSIVPVVGDDNVPNKFISISFPVENKREQVMKVHKAVAAK